MPRYLFIVPTDGQPSGGVSVILDFVMRLQELGFQAEAITDRPDYSYRFASTGPRMIYAPQIGAALARMDGRKFWRRWRRRLSSAFGAVKPMLDLRPDDVIIVPEFGAGLYPHGFPDNQCVLLVQGHYIFASVICSEGYDGDRFAAVISTSQACDRITSLYGCANRYMIPLQVDEDLFSYSEIKQPVIAFMPRRREEEIKLIMELLRRSGRLTGRYEFCPIDQMPRQKVAEMMGRARIFLSFSQNEGFGLPPAEAMAAGCIVIGYTGVGGDEFLTSESGFPVPDGDLSSYVDTILQVVEEYDEDPARLDEMRRKASQMVLSRYSAQKQKARLREVFSDLDASLSRAR